MNWRKFNFFVFFLFISVFASAQSIDVEQIDQIWRPRVKIESRYFVPTKFNDTLGKYSNFEQRAIFTFPIKTKFKVDGAIDLSDFKLKSIIKNSLKTIELEASQTMGSIRVERRNVKIGFDSLPQKQLYNFSASIFGLKLTKKYKILFYNVSLNHAEENKTLNHFALRVNAIGGRFHIRSLRKNFYYGALLSYSDKSFLPVPFFGGAQPLSDKLTLNYTLPAYISVAYELNNKLTINSGVTIDGYKSGILFQEKRTNISNTNWAAFANANYSVGQSFNIKAELGYNFYSSLSYTKSNFYRYNYAYGKGVYVQFTLSQLMGKTLFEKIISKVNPF
jgi:hypothetical protein